MSPNRQILIGTPAHGGHITVQTATSVAQARDECQSRGWEVRFLPLVGSADVADMRNQLVGLFLNTTCTDLVFVDADISWGPGNFARLLEHDVDVVAGLYRERTDDRVAYPGVPSEPRTVVWGTRGPLVKADVVPAGFLRVTRNCLEVMARAPGVRRVSDGAKLAGLPYPFLFDWTWTGDDVKGWRRLSEDFTFCHRWREAGGEVWIDPAIKLDHVGQKVFRGDLMGFIQSSVLAGAPMSDPASAARAALAVSEGVTA